MQMLQIVTGPDMWSVMTYKNGRLTGHRLEQF